METIARYLMIGGIILFLIGVGIYVAVKFGIPLGRLPGDIHIKQDGFSLYFPITSAILVSVILTLVLNLLIWLLKNKG